MRSRFAYALIAIACVTPYGAMLPAAAASAAPADTSTTLGPLVDAAASTSGWSRVIIAAPSDSAAEVAAVLVERAGGRLGRRLPIIAARVAWVPSSALAALATHPEVAHIVAMASFFAAPAGAAAPASDEWSRQIVCGTRRYSDLPLDAASTAWMADTTWGAPCANARCAGYLSSQPFHNAVWGTRYGGADCQERWLLSSVAVASDDTVVWGTDDTVVWGTLDDDTVVWGTDNTTVVWGTGDDDTVVWGTGDTVVWGTGDDTVVWGTRADDLRWSADAP